MRLANNSKSPIQTAQKNQLKKSGLSSIKSLVKKAANVAKHVDSSPVSLSISAAAKLLASSKSDEKAEAKPEVKKSQEVPATIFKKSKGKINKPGLFFIGGFQLFSSTPFGNGVKDMSESIKGAKYFGWNDKAAIKEEILKRTHDAPIVLVGHSLGGDTAVEIANELNSLEHQFRKN